MKHICKAPHHIRHTHIPTHPPAKQPLLLLTRIHDQHEQARAEIKFPTCCGGPSPPPPYSVWPRSSPARLLACPRLGHTLHLAKADPKKTPEFWATPGLSKPNGWGRWSFSLCFPTNLLSPARTTLGWSGVEEIYWNFLMVVCSWFLLLLRSSQLCQRNAGVTTAREGLIYISDVCHTWLGRNWIIPWGWYYKGL